ncbi:MAG: diacylglycerol kinase [Gammaproteobacteria bacterium]|jgi:diacylglycerol kinase (ATP)|nr:diacylglycerol kinase [Gammaproteobacteria bacterium]
MSQNPIDESGAELTRLVRATGNSLSGLRRVWRDERAFRTEVVVLAALIPLALWLAGDALEFALLVGVWLIVIAGELGNSAVEATVDRIGTENHELSGKAKDAASAMVMILIVIAALVWLGFLLGKSW